MLVRNIIIYIYVRCRRGVMLRKQIRCLRRADEARERMAKTYKVLHTWLWLLCALYACIRLACFYQEAFRCPWIMYVLYAESITRRFPSPRGPRGERVRFNFIHFYIGQYERVIDYLLFTSAHTHIYIYYNIGSIAGYDNDATCPFLARVYIHIQELI